MPKEITLPYVRAEGYRTVLIDSIGTVLLSTVTSDRVIVHFTRVDSVPTGEKAWERDDGGFDILPGAEMESHHQKTLEFSAEIRPDIALAIANNLIRTIAGMSDNRKALYGIPKNISQIQPVTPAP